ncbi:MAG: hypothetical protein KAS23_03235 [Anaerohalosphaera sp.]|nr:hypothetical protein [Anaerohalosphaera sp.]
MSLRDIFCQERALGTLQRAYGAGKMAHAYIFAGAEGVGKFKTASQWAKMLLCHDKVTSQNDEGGFVDSCGKCESCLVFDGDGHPDFVSIYKELSQFTEKGKGKTTPVDMPIDVIREFLLDKVASRPGMGDKSVYVVSESERLNIQSQNALLKVLEEPPAHCIIILLCTRLDNLLPTTQSRCQVVRFGDIDEERIVEKLATMNVSRDEATYWARFAEGSLGTAINWARLELKDTSCYAIKRELVKRIATYRLEDSLDLAEWMCGASKKISQAWSEIEEGTSKTAINRRAQKGLMMIIAAVWRDVLRLQNDFSDRIINSDQIAEIQHLASKYPDDGAIDRINKVYENMFWVEKSVNEKLIFEELLLNFAGSGTL